MELRLQFSTNHYPSLLPRYLFAMQTLLWDLKEPCAGVWNLLTSKLVWFETNCISLPQSSHPSKTDPSTLVLELFTMTRGKRWGQHLEPRKSSVNHGSDEEEFQNGQWECGDSPRGTPLLSAIDRKQWRPQGALLLTGFSLEFQSTS